MTKTYPAAATLQAVNHTKAQVRELSDAIATIARGIAAAQAAAKRLENDCHQIDAVNNPEELESIRNWLDRAAPSLRTFQDQLVHMTANACGAHYAAELAAQSERAS